jgi:maleate isomerase
MREMSRVESTRRLGLLVPSSNSVMEVDFYRNLPPSCTLHVSRMHLSAVTVAGEEAMLDTFLPQAVEDLASLRPHALVFGCTSAGALRGNAYERRLCLDLERRTGARVVSVNAAVRQSLRKLGVTGLGVVTPYLDELNGRIRSSLEDDGFRVVCIDGLGLSDNEGIAAVAPEAIATFAIDRLQGKMVDAAFISCTNFRGAQAAGMVRAQLGVPVVTSNLAALEAVAGLLGFHLPPRPGAG